jgi:hypothetical protein
MEPETIKCPHCVDGLVARIVMPASDIVRKHLEGMPGYGKELCARCGGAGRILKPKSSDAPSAFAIPEGYFSVWGDVQAGVNRLFGVDYGTKPPLTAIISLDKPVKVVRMIEETDDELRHRFKKAKAAYEAALEPVLLSSTEDLVKWFGSQKKDE